MKRGKKLLCLGMALSLIWTGTAFGEEYIPPNPLSGGTQAENSALLQGPGGTAPNAAQPSGSVDGPSSGQTDGPGGQADASGGQADASGGQTDTSGGQAGIPAQISIPADIPAPAVQAEGAVLIDCGSGQVLFGKNADTQFYPASITKVMTALLTIENCSLSDVVTFSQSATTNLESGAVTLDLTAGDQLTVEQCLYALLLKSANEVANGLAEHMSGSVAAFADKMNERAAQLGCTGTHFVNPNGLNNDAHLTTPHDMALIARAAYANPVLSKISTTTSYEMPATLKSGPRVITMGHKMNYTTDSRYYPGMAGGKTGYTSKAKNTLVTCVEQNGIRLVAVVMKASGTHYTDTKAMLDYGFTVMQAQAPQEPSAQSAQPSQEPAVQPAQDPAGTGNNALSQGPGSRIQTGWVQSGTLWYYYHATGQMAKSEWVQANEKWYYLGADGAMLANATTPDGYYVGADGAWQ